ncbi:hypothetical protein AB0L88_39655 [Saccharopolyspora shandongensis]
MLGLPLLRWRLLAVAGVVLLVGAAGLGWEAWQDHQRQARERLPESCS